MKQSFSTKSLVLRDLPSSMNIWGETQKKREREKLAGIKIWWEKAFLSRKVNDQFMKDATRNTGRWK